MKKLIIQIPCFNEEKTLPITLESLPREIPGIDVVETLIIDDGSTDRTVAVAREHGVDHVVRLTNNKGLAEGFMAGLDACLKLGADIIVNTDGDNQYNNADIEKLVIPILQEKADMVVGARPIEQIEHFSLLKKKLQNLGSWVVRQISGTDIPDTTSGFRALSREAALQLNVVSAFTYTLETIIQAGKKNVAVTHVPVRTNEKLRNSRLFKNMFAYIKRSVNTMFRIYTMYEPMKIFMAIGSIPFLLALLISARYLYFFVIGEGQGHIQSLILAAILYIVSFQVWVVGLLADLIGANRKLIEKILYRVKKIEIEK